MSDCHVGMCEPLDKFWESLLCNQSPGVKSGKNGFERTVIVLKVMSEVAKPPALGYALSIASPGLQDIPTENGEVGRGQRQVNMKYLLKTFKVTDEVVVQLFTWNSNRKKRKAAGNKQKKSYPQICQFRLSVQAFQRFYAIAAQIQCLQVYLENKKQRSPQAIETNPKLNQHLQTNSPLNPIMT